MYYTYIATNFYNTVLYTGVTSDLKVRMQQHAERKTKGFTAHYNVYKLIWYEEFQTPYEAIAVEKRIKGWRRERKIAMIKKTNPKFIDLLNDPQDSSQSSG